MITNNSVIRKTSGNLSSSIDNESVILGIRSGNYYGFNRMGSDLWEKLNNPVLVEDLITDYTLQYPDDADAIRRDIIHFLSNLLEKNLIEIVDEKD